MVKKSKKSKSKRVSLKKKHKIIKKVKEHHRKKAKEAKKLGLNKKRKIEKDPGIPNDWPFKEQELKALEVRRARAIEELEEKKAARKERIKVSITVGIVGLPNVGKSSVINSLKRSHVVNVGATPGLTRSMQEIQLDKNVKLLDCPGVVILNSGESDASIALRNCKRIEKLDDPISPVKEIIKLCPAEKLMSLYKLPNFSTVDDFLQKVARFRGRLKKGGILDIEATARIILHDWNGGKIPYYTNPPVRSQGENLESVVVSEFGKVFNIDEVYNMESSFIGSLTSVDDFAHLEVPPGSPLSFDEQMMGKDDLEPALAAEPIEGPMESDGKETVGTKGNSVTRQYDKLYTAEGILDPRVTKAEKKRRKQRKQSMANDMDADYDFKVDYHMKDSTSEANTASEEGSDNDEDAEIGVPMSGVDLDA